MRTRHIRSGLIVLLTTLAVVAGMAVPVSAEKPHNEKQSILFVAAWPEGEWAEDNVVFVADGDRQEAGADFSIDDGCITRSISSDGDFESASLVVSPLNGKDRLMNAEGTVEGLWVEVEYEDCSDGDFSWEGRVDVTFLSEGYGKPWRDHEMEDRSLFPGELNLHRLTRWTQRAANTWVTINFPDDDEMDDWNIGPMDSVISAESNSIHENRVGNPLILPGWTTGGDVVAKGQILADALNEATGLGFYVVVAEDPREMYELMCAKPRQSFGLVSPATYSLASVDCDVDASFKAIRFGSDSFWTQFLVPKASDIDEIGDLHGLKWAYSDMGSLSSYLVPLAMMNAIEPDPVIPGAVLEAGGHPQAIMAVSEGEADFATTGVFPPIPENVKVLVVSPPIPNDAVAFGSQFPPGLRAQVEAALIELANESGPNYEDVWDASVGDLYRWQGITPAVDAEWDWLRTVLEAAGIGIDDL